MITRPMLAGKCTNLHKIQFPVIGSPKIDGIRCLRINGRSLSRSFKLIPNKWIQYCLENLPNGLDGELVGTHDFGLKLDNFQQTTSKIMTYSGVPEFKYLIFDYVSSDLNEPYIHRLVQLKKLSEFLPNYCEILPNTKLYSLQDLATYQENILFMGYEGICIRKFRGPYKCGRSTENEGYLLKIKPYEDAEAIIIGFDEQLTNTNSPEKDNFGRIKRSSAKYGKIGSNTLGKFKVKGLTAFKGLQFNVGTGIGLTKELRQRIWNNPEHYIDKIIIFKYQKVGTKDLPRSPVFKGFRDKEDI